MQSVRKNSVLIQVLEPPASELVQLTDIERDKVLKQQNRGTVVMVGSEVDWPSAGDVVSFYRAASVPIKDDDGTDYVLVNEAHILAKF